MTKATGADSIAGQALDFVAEYPGSGEQRWHSNALGTEQVSLSWRRMLPRTGGRAATATRAREQVYVVISDRVTFKAGDDVFEAGPAARGAATSEEFYSVHNDSDAEAELLTSRRGSPTRRSRSWTASGVVPH
jgi:hypothetical protein